MILPDLNNHEVQSNIMIAKKSLAQKSKNRSISYALQMRIAKEFIHRDREFQSLKDDFVLLNV